MLKEPSSARYHGPTARRYSSKTHSASIIRLVNRKPSPDSNMEPIKNEQLTLENVPLPDANWSDILDFALTFEGYEFWGSFERCAEVAAARAHGTLTCLRTCLFFEQRFWCHNNFALPPSKKKVLYLQSVIRKIRAAVLKESLSPGQLST